MYSMYLLILESVCCGDRGRPSVTTCTGGCALWILASCNHNNNMTTSI